VYVAAINEGGKRGASVVWDLFSERKKEIIRCEWRFGTIARNIQLMHLILLSRAC
jgi:hypothetical protein